VNIVKLLIRWIITVIALIVAALVVPGISVQDERAWVAFGVMALILGLVNAFIRPLLTLLSCGCIILTMGLFMLVINALTLWLSSYIAVNVFDVGFRVDGFWPAFWGALIVSVVSFVLSLFVKED